MERKSMILVALVAVAMMAAPAFAGHGAAKHRREAYSHGWGPGVYVPAPRVYTPHVVVRPRPIYDYPGYYVPPVYRGHRRDHCRDYGWQYGGIGVHTGNFDFHIRF